MDNNFNRQILEEYCLRPIAYIPTLSCLCGSATGGLFMSQMLYWWQKGRDISWVYKTVRELNQETLLTKNQQKRAIDKWKELGVLEVDVRGVPPKRHFKINIEKLKELMAHCLENTPYGTLHVRPLSRRSPLIGRIGRNTTYSTSESTTETTSDNSIINNNTTSSQSSDVDQIFDWD